MLMNQHPNLIATLRNLHPILRVKKKRRWGNGVALTDLNSNRMMAHLTQALEQGKDIGHYGRLVFTMVARHFADENELVEYLQKNPGFSEEEARALVAQVQ